MPELHIICAGSQLELALGESPFPVGRVDFEWMYPLSFSEFLQALEHDLIIKYIPSLSSEVPIPETIHQKIIDYLRLYFIIGGMPEAVVRFKETNSITEVANVHKSLWLSFQQDFLKYHRKMDVDCLNHIFEAIPNTIGKHIKYTNLYPEKRIEKIKECLNILEKSMLIHKAYCSNASGLPLSAGISDKILNIFFAI
ncbi:MAG: ATP-binding protein [Bacteroidia bacterium]|nr:ATP-binding protein [Bacteroidia bacterium]